MFGEGRDPIHLMYLTRKVGIHLYVAAITIAACFALRSAWLFVQPGVPVFTLASFGALALVLELGSVSLAHKARGSVAFIVHIAVAILFGAAWAAIEVAVVSLLSDVSARKEPIRIVFNVAQRVLGIIVATQV